MRRSAGRGAIVLSLALAAVLLGGSTASLLGTCGPFTDTAGDSFCSFILEVFYLGITTGTTPTTYDPASAVSRTQMAAFLSRSVDGVLKRGSRRAALRQVALPAVGDFLGLTTVGNSPAAVECDGADVWVLNNGSGTVSRVRASDGRLLETWTALSGSNLIVALGRVFICATGNPGKLYSINPSQAAGTATTVASNLGNSPQSLVFDGARIWTGNFLGSVSIVVPGAAIPWTSTTVTVGFTNPGGVTFDGSFVWVTDNGANKILKLDSAGAILQSVTVGANPGFPTFDGTSFWVPSTTGNSISVVRASNGSLLATLTGNGLSLPLYGAFDGQRILFTNAAGGANSVSLFKAADLTPLGSFSTGSGSGPIGAASDGVHFWIGLNTAGKLARF